jgi:hypothetical protein
MTKRPFSVGDFALAVALGLASLLGGRIIPMLIPAWYRREIDYAIGCAFGLLLLLVAGLVLYYNLRNRRVGRPRSD